MMILSYHHNWLLSVWVGGLVHGGIISRRLPAVRQKAGSVTSTGHSTDPPNASWNYQRGIIKYFVYNELYVYVSRVLWNSHWTGDALRVGSTLVARLEMKYAGHMSTCRLGNMSHLFLFVIWVAWNTVTEHLHCSVYFSSI